MMTQNIEHYLSNSNFFQNLTAQFSTSFDKSIYLHISSHLKKDYKYHPRLNELSEILSKRENLEDL